MGREKGIKFRSQSSKRAPAIPRKLLDDQILNILGGSQIPLSAYKIADRMRDRGHGIPVMSTYRALDRLVDEEKVQKVETVSGFRVQDDPQGMVLICSGCQRTVSLNARMERQSLEKAANAGGFLVSKFTIEVTGRCTSCSAT